MKSYSTFLGANESFLWMGAEANRGAAAGKICCPTGKRCTSWESQNNQLSPTATEDNLLASRNSIFYLFLHSPDHSQDARHDNFRKFKPCLDYQSRIGIRLG